MHPRDVVSYRVFPRAIVQTFKGGLWKQSGERGEGEDKEGERQ